MNYNDLFGFDNTNDRMSVFGDNKIKMSDRVLKDYFDSITYPLNCNLEEEINKFIKVSKETLGSAYEEVDRDYVRDYIVNNVIEDGVIYILFSNVDNIFCLNYNNSAETSNFLNEVEDRILIRSFYGKNSWMLLDFIKVGVLIRIYETIRNNIEIFNKVDSETMKTLKEIYDLAY